MIRSFDSRLVGPLSGHTPATSVLAASVVAFSLAACSSGNSVDTVPGVDGLPQPTEVSRIDVTFRSEHFRLVGTLTLPPGNGPFPAVILLSGSGPQDRNGETAGFVPGYQPSRNLAEHLAGQGIASLRYDERGVGASTGSHASASTADLAEDAEAALMYLSSVDDIDPEKIGLVGQSEGANIVAMVAARRPDVAFAIALAGSAVSGYDLILAQSEHALRHSGLTGAELEAAMARVRGEYDLILHGEWETLESKMREVLPAQLEAMPPAQRAELGTPEEIVAEELTRMRNWLRFFLTYDPAEDWSRVRAPVLAVFGGLDVQVPVEQNQEPLEAALGRAPTGDWTVQVFPNANHLFQEAVTGNPDEYFRLEPEIHTQVLDAISSWIRERTSQ